MTTGRQAVDELARLHRAYCPLLDALLAMARSAPEITPAPGFAWWSSVDLSTDTTDRTILEEQRQAERIWTLGKIAWGEAASARLMMMKAGPDELRVVEKVLKWRRLDDAHRAALIGCCVRSQRLSEYLAESKVQNEPDKGRRCLVRWIAMEAELGPPPPRGKAKRIREIAVLERCDEDTAKKAIQRGQRGTVPK